MRFSRTTLLPLGVALAAGLALWGQAPAPSAGPGKGKGKGKAAEASEAPEAGKGKGRGGAAEAAKAPTPPPVPQVLRLVRPNLYLVTGHGANILFLPTPAGVIVVDTKLPGEGDFERLTELIRGISPEPIKVVYNTHHHQDHTGNNRQFLAAGAQVIASEQLKVRLAAYAATPKPAPPSVTFATSHVTRLGGSEARAYHFGPGHTGGDSVVLFPAQRLLAISDLVTAGRGPVIDYAGGASLVGWLHSLDEILKLDWTLAVPGNGEPVDRAFVEAYRRNLQVLLDRARAAVARGVSQERLLSELKTDDLGWMLQMDPDRLNGFYAEVSAAR